MKYHGKYCNAIKYCHDIKSSFISKNGKFAFSTETLRNFSSYIHHLVTHSYGSVRVLEGRTCKPMENAPHLDQSPPIFAVVIGYGYLSVCDNHFKDFISTHARLCKPSVYSAIFRFSGFIMWHTGFWWQYVDRRISVQGCAYRTFGNNTQY